MLVVFIRRFVEICTLSIIWTYLFNWGISFSCGLILQYNSILKLLRSQRWAALCSASHFTNNHASEHITKRRINRAQHSWSLLKNTYLYFIAPWIEIGKKLPCLKGYGQEPRKQIRDQCIFHFFSFLFIYNRVKLSIIHVIRVSYR